MPNAQRLASKHVYHMSDFARLSNFLSSLTKPGKTCVEGDEAGPFGPTPEAVLVEKATSGAWSPSVSVGSRSQAARVLHGLPHHKQGKARCNRSVSQVKTLAITARSQALHAMLAEWKTRHALTHIQPAGPAMITNCVMLQAR